MNHPITSSILCTGMLLVLGCSPSQDLTSSTRQSDMPPGEKYLLTAEPENAKGVIEVRSNAKDGDTVTVVGRIGGSKAPWIDGRAAFSLVDLSLLACSDKEGDQCEAPWDYCCETDRLPQATVLIKLVDASGNLIPENAREFLGVKELQTLVIEGNTKCDEAGNVTILADALYVKPDPTSNEP